jgi:PAS domain S-box-containing protein
VLDEGRKIVGLNPAAESLVGGHNPVGEEVYELLSGLPKEEQLTGPQPTEALIAGRHWEVVNRPVSNQLGSGRLLFLRDISVRKEAEIQQRESEMRYRRLYESLTDAVVAIDMGGHILETNPAFDTMLGYTGEELRQLTYQELTPAKWHDFEAKIVAEQTLATGHSEVFEKEMRKRDGTVFPVELRKYLLRDETNQPTGMWAIVREITARKRAEAELRESEKRLKYAERLAHVGHWEWNIETNQVFCSEEILRIFGRPQDYVPSYEGFLESVAPQDLKRFERWIRDCLAEKRGCPFEFQIVRPNGELRTLTCICEVSVDEQGLPVRLFVTDHDITDLKRAQQESLVKQKLETVGTLAAGIAHDFNNLLGVIVAESELLLEAILFT